MVNYWLGVVLFYFPQEGGKRILMFYCRKLVCRLCNYSSCLFLYNILFLEICFIIFAIKRHRQRQRTIFHRLFHTQKLEIARPGLNWRQEPRSPMWTVRAQTLEPSLLPPGVWISWKLEWGAGIGLKLRHSNMGWRHLKQHLNNSITNSCPQVTFLI